MSLRQEIRALLSNEGPVEKGEFVYLLLQLLERIEELERQLEEK